MQTTYGGLLEIDMSGEEMILRLDGQHGITSIEVTPRSGVIVRHLDGSISHAEQIDIHDVTHEVTLHGLSSFI